MAVRNAPPHAGATLESLRGLGYGLTSALADIIDNSISAGATEVVIRFDWKGAQSRILIADDGRGMDDAGLEAAMRLGARDPRFSRDAGDLGRFGMGLKTASFSQARRLTVASRAAGGSLCCLRWDLDRIADAGVDWPLFEGADPASREAVEEFAVRPQGTLVIWEVLDRLVTDGFDAEAMIAQIDRVEAGLAMIFHRLLGRGPGLFRLVLNGRAVAPWDPFLAGHPAKALESAEMRLNRTSGVFVQAHVLPHRDMIAPAAFDAVAGPAGWIAQQGFHIYRNRRLLLAGSWLGLGEKGRAWTCDEAHRLVRIRLDIPNSLDAEWKIDVLKSGASPPHRLRPQLQRIAAEARARARQVLMSRGHLSPAATRAGAAPLQETWQMRRGPQGTSWRIARDHALVSTLLERAGPLKPEIEALLRLVEATVPVERIWLDVEGSAGAAPPALSAEARAEMCETLEALLEAMIRFRGLSVTDALADLARTPPFDRHPDLVAELSARAAA